MKIVVFGAGAIGGYIGGRLAQAGHEVTFIARGEHLRAMVADGLKVTSIAGDFSVAPARATDQPETVGVIDVVLCCVKSWQVEQVSGPISSLVGPETVVITVQNGVEAHTILSRSVNPAQVLSGLCKMICMIEAPGCIRHAGMDPYLAFGVVDGRAGRRVQAVAKGFADVQGLTVVLSEDILADLWRKFMLIAPWSGVGALTRVPIGMFRSVPGSRDILLGSIREVYDVARANGANVPEAAVPATIDFIDQLPPEGTSSMQRDIMAGRPSELNEQSGAVVRFAKRGGIDAPINRFIYHSLLPMELVARGELAAWPQSA